MDDAFLRQYRPDGVIPLGHGFRNFLNIRMNRAIFLSCRVRNVRSACNRSSSVAAFSYRSVRAWMYNKKVDKYDIIEDRKKEE